MAVGMATNPHAGRHSALLEQLCGFDGARKGDVRRLQENRPAVSGFLIVVGRLVRIVDALRDFLAEERRRS